MGISACWSAMLNMATLPFTHFSQVVKLSVTYAVQMRRYRLFKHPRRYTQDGLLWPGGIIFLNLPLVARMMIAQLRATGQITFFRVRTVIPTR